MSRVRSPFLAAATLVGLVLLTGLLIFIIVRDAPFYMAAPSYPFQFDYGEGIVWQQMRDMVDGSAYGPLSTYPAVVYHYPPVFHLVTAALAAMTGSDELATGRFVSLAGTAASAGLVAALVSQASRSAAPSPVRWPAGIFAGLLFLTMEPVGDWAAMMRVDTLAGAFSLLGLLLSIRALERPAAIYPAALAFVLSVYTKQTMIAAPAAAFGVLIFARPPLAWRGIASAMVAGLLALGILSLLTEGRFFQHLVLYNVNSVDYSKLWTLGEYLLEFLPIIGLATIGAVRAIASLLASRANGGIGRGEPATAMAILLLFLAIKTAMLVMFAKMGASSNYLIEWFSALCIFAGIAVVQPIAFARGYASKAPAIWLLLLIAALFVGIAAQLLTSLSHNLTRGQMAEKARLLQPLVARIAASPRPVLSDDMTLLIRAGRKVEWEPAIVAELIRVGRYDEKPLLRMIEERRFGFFITQGVQGQPLFNERYTPATARAMAAAYPRLERIVGLTLHLPPEPAR